MGRSKAILVILMICLVCRLIFFLAVKPWDQQVRDRIILKADALEYHQLAITMAQDHQFAYKKDGPTDTFRTPLYPLFVSLIYFAQGQPRPWTVLIIQILIDTASCLLLFFLLAKFLTKRIASYASLFYAVDPFFILYSITLLSDILFVFLCILGAIFFSVPLAREFKERSSVWIALCALTFGLATLVRPVAQFIPFIICFFLLYFLRKDMKKGLGLIMLFFLFFLLTLSPWMIRNLVRFGTPSLSTVGSYDLVILYVQPMEIERRGQPFGDVRKALLKEADQLMIRDGKDPQRMNEFQKDPYWRRLAFHYVAQYPFSFLKHFLFGILHTMGNLATGPYAELLQLSNKTSNFQIKGHSTISGLIKGWFNQKSRGEIGIGLTIALYSTGSYFLWALGLIVFWKTWRHQPFLWFSLLMTFYFIFIAGSAGLARYKLPAVPFYLAFVGLGLHHILYRNKRE